MTISFIIINHHYQNHIITNITVISYYSCVIHDHYKLSKYVLDKKDKRKKIVIITVITVIILLSTVVTDTFSPRSPSFGQHQHDRAL